MSLTPNSAGLSQQSADLMLSEQQPDAGEVVSEVRRRHDLFLLSDPALLVGHVPVELPQFARFAETRDARQLARGAPRRLFPSAACDLIPAVGRTACNLATIKNGL